MNQLKTLLGRHWLPLLGLNAAIAAATVYSLENYQKSFSPEWTASAKLNMPVKTIDINTNLGTLGNIQDDGQLGFSREINPLNLQMSVLNSNLVIGRALAADPEQELYPTVESYRGLFEVVPGEQSTTLSLKTTASSPELAQKRLEGLINAYQQRLDELRQQDMQVREQYAQTELNKSLISLEKSQQALESFRKSTGIVDVSEQQQGLLAAINNLRAERIRTLAQGRAQETQVAAISNNLGMGPQQAIQALRLAEDDEYQAFRGKLAEVQTELADVRGNYTDAHPRVQRVLARRDQLQAQMQQRLSAIVPDATGIDTSLGNTVAADSRLRMINDLLDAQIATAGLQQQAQQMAQQLQTLTAELGAISQNSERLLALQRDYEVAESIYKGAIAQFEQSRTNPFNAYPNIQILDGVAVGSMPSEPNLKLIKLGGLLAALFGSAGLVAALESRKPLLQPKDLTQVELPVLVNIARLKQSAERMLRNGDIDLEFQRLATVIQSLLLESNRLLVTSATFGEGKTTVTLGLALGLVHLGFRVLLVDGDLRRGDLTRRLGAANNDEPVNLQPGLDLLPAPLIPKDKVCEYCARGGFTDSLDRAGQSEYDYVLVDSAPVSLSVEPLLMSAAIRNVLFVVRPGKSDRFSAMDSFKQLEQHNARIAGLVVNGIESRGEGYRYGQPRELLEVSA